MKGKSSRDLVDKIVRDVSRYGQRVTAEKFGVSPQYIHDVINFRRGVSKQLARKLGYKPKLTWIRVDNNEEDNL